MDNNCDGAFDSELLSDADTIYTSSALYHLGSSLSSAGDTDGNGLDDMFIGARDHRSEHRGPLLRGRNRPRRGPTGTRTAPASRWAQG